jgi:hypothetical protein
MSHDAMNTCGERARSRGAGCGSPRECPRSRLVGNLPNDGRGQEFLIRPQRQHVMLSDRMQQPATLGQRLPPASQHVEMSTGPEPITVEPHLKIGGRPGPISGQSIDEQILEQHLARLDQGSARL